MEDEGRNRLIYPSAPDPATRDVEVKHIPYKEMIYDIHLDVVGNPALTRPHASTCSYSDPTRSDYTSSPGTSTRNLHDDGDAQGDTRGFQPACFTDIADLDRYYALQVLPVRNKKQRIGRCSVPEFEPNPNFWRYFSLSPLNVKSLGSNSGRYAWKYSAGIQQVLSVRHRVKFELTRWGRTRHFVTASEYFVYLLSSCANHDARKDHRPERLNKDSILLLQGEVPLTVTWYPRTTLAVSHISH